MTSALHYLDLTELSRRLHAREISPVEATTAELTRIERFDGQLKSFAHMMAESALVQARAAEAEIMRGEIRGPLHGVPIAVKDLCWTQGVPTAAGMMIYKDFRPTEDATVVRKLYAAGAIILGKLQLTEGAWANTTRRSRLRSTHGTRRTGRAPRRAVRAWRQPPDFATAHSAPTPAVPFGSLARPTASPGSSRPGAGSADMACSNWRRRLITLGRWRVVQRIAAQCSV
jgi:Asp-tRNA(Asn)/Glu-tRNA(Gln) amidotransferase A subunit family amidase